MIEGKSGSATSNVMITGIHTQALTSTRPTIPPQVLQNPFANHQDQKYARPMTFWQLGLLRKAADHSNKEELRMCWYHYVAYFFGGAFLANAIPHFVSGVTGHPFQSPFAKPPGQGLSPAWVNVLWGAANLVFAYLLLGRVGNFEFRRWRHILVAGAGGLAMAVMLSRAFGRFYGGL